MSLESWSLWVAARPLRPASGRPAPLSRLPRVTADLTVAQGQVQEVDAGATYRPRSDFPGCPGTDVCLGVSDTPRGCAAEPRTAPAITAPNSHARSLNFWKEVVEIKRTKGLASWVQ